MLTGLLRRLSTSVCNDRHRGVPGQTGTAVACLFDTLVDVPLPDSPDRAAETEEPAPLQRSGVAFTEIKDVRC